MSRTGNDLKGIHDLLKVERLEPLISLERARYLTPSRRQKKLNIIEKLKNENFKDINTLEYFVAVLLSSDSAILTDKLSENIENFIIFSTLLDRIRDAIKKGSYLSFIGSGLRTMGGAVRGGEDQPTKFSDLMNALEQFRLSSQRKLGKVGGNLLRGMGEKITGERTTLFRVIKRTIDGKNPFRKDLSESQRGLGRDDDTLMEVETPFLSPYSKKDRVLISIVHALLRNFRHGKFMDEGGKEFNPALHYIHYMYLYGFPQFDFGLKQPETKYSNSPNKVSARKKASRSGKSTTNYQRRTCYYDRIWCQGLGMYVFIDLPDSYSNEKEFLIRCTELEKNWEELITFGEREVDLDALTYWEVKFLRETHLKNRGLGKKKKKKNKKKNKKRKKRGGGVEEESLVGEREEEEDELVEEEEEDRKILMSDIREIKNELVRKEEKEMIFLDVYRTLSFYKEQREKLRKKNDHFFQDTHRKKKKKENDKDNKNNNSGVNNNKKKKNKEDDGIQILSIEDETIEEISSDSDGLEEGRGRKSDSHEGDDDSNAIYQFGSTDSPSTDKRLYYQNKKKKKKQKNDEDNQGVHREINDNRGIIGTLEDSPSLMKESSGEFDMMELFDEFSAGDNHNKKRKKRGKTATETHGLDNEEEFMFNEEIRNIAEKMSRDDTSNQHDSMNEDDNDSDSNKLNNVDTSTTTTSDMMTESMYLTDLKSDSLTQSVINQEISSSFAQLRKISMDEKEEEELFKTD